MRWVDRRVLVFLTTIVLFVSLDLSVPGQTKLASKDPLRRCSKISFIYPSDGWVICSTGSRSSVLGSTDGGISWTSQYQTDEGLRDLQFADVRNGWVIGTHGTILHTVDGGKSWSRQDSGVKEDFLALAVLGKNEAWAVGANGFIAHTDNAGVSWSSTHYLKNNSLYGVGFASPSTGYAVGYGKILSTENGGKTWRTIDSDDLKHLGVVSVKDDCGWISSETVVFGMKDKKIDMRPMVLPGQGKITGINCVDNEYGFVIKTRATGGGENDSEGFVLRTIDGGVSWQKMASYRSNRDDSYLFVSISFVDRLHGWVLGRNGTILRTADGGMSWAESRVTDRIRSDGAG